MKLKDGKLYAYPVQNKWAARGHLRRTPVASILWAEPSVVCGVS